MYLEIANPIASDEETNSELLACCGLQSAYTMTSGRLDEYCVKTVKCARLRKSLYRPNLLPTTFTLASLP